MINGAKGVWNFVQSGFRRMTSGFRRAIGGEERLGGSVDEIIASNVWTIPAAGIATGLLFQDQIEELIEDLIGRMLR